MLTATFFTDMVFLPDTYFCLERIDYFFPDYLHVHYEVRYYLKIVIHRNHYIMYIEDMEPKLLFKGC